MNKKRDYFNIDSVEISNFIKGKLVQKSAIVKRENGELFLEFDDTKFDAQMFVNSFWEIGGCMASTLQELTNAGFTNYVEDPNRPEEVRKENERIQKAKEAHRKRQRKKESPYFNRSGDPILKDSCCVYADVLGFTDSIKEHTNQGEDENLLKLLFAEIDRSYRELEERKGWVPKPLWSFKFFTDNIVLGYPRLETSPWEDAESEFGRTFGMIARHQLLLAGAGFFLRGGLAYGKLHLSNHVVFGSALLEAHTIENERAIYPRIVLHENAISKIDEQIQAYADPTNTPQNDYLLIDNDGEVFLNYLIETIQDDGHNEKILLEHKAHINKRLNMYLTVPKVHKKYLWLAKYHNFFCRTFLTKTPSRYLVTTEREEDFFRFNTRYKT